MFLYFEHTTSIQRMGCWKKASTMQGLKRITKRILLGMFVVAISFLPLTATGAKVSANSKTITLEIGGAQVIKFEQGASEVFIANPDVADVQLSSKHTAYVFGKTVGTTKLFAMDEKGKEILNVDVIITYNLTHLKELIAAYDPHELVEIKSVPGGIIIEGVVDTPVTAENIRSLAEKFLTKTADQTTTVINRLTIKSPVQVDLRVKVVEVNRTVFNKFGINWQSVINYNHFKFAALTGRAPFTSTVAGVTPNLLTDNVTQLTQPIVSEAGQNIPNINTIGANFTNPHFNINTAIDLLSQEGLVTILAEPNLIAVSGETASFLAGGEFPYPIPQQFGQVSIDFKQFGVSLAFTPTVLDGKLISMRVRPEVSELDFTTGTSVLGTTVPGILTRRAETTVQLASGQTFAIAGLLKQVTASTIGAVPGLGDLPVLGALFRSNDFQRGNSELVILVTPYLVEPTSGKEMLTPMDGMSFATFVEQIFERRMVKQGPQKGEAPAFGPGGVRLIGPAGFSIE